MEAGKSKVRGVVSEIGLERDDEHFRSFNLKVSIVIKPLKSVNYEEGEKLMKQFRKNILGKEVEFTPIIFRCPSCGREFNNEQGLNKHLKMAHKDKTPLKKGKTKKIKGKPEDSAKQAQL
ncbi:C2H2-type zinc finger protein [Candidatus Bathyarchaeota archaeon]|nr:C2H2-type zinc finger protein [Candidatus Bathyarchaeota archaeon]MBS7630238.1 C2H2-type zinc finger protein [Candidatus Bathyarchaeota archaeon]